MNTPPAPTDEEELLRLARRRVALKLGWWVHAAVFLLVNLGLYAVNARHGGTPWHLWPLGWWGLGLAIHGLAVLFALRGAGLRARLVERELQALRRGR